MAASRAASLLTGVLILTAAGSGAVGGIRPNPAAASETTVSLSTPYRHTMSITHEARESANPEPLTLPVSSRSVHLVLPDPTLLFASAHFRAFGANFETVGTIPLDRASHSVTVPLPRDFFAVSANHLPLQGLVASDPAEYYGIELIGTGEPGAGPPPTASVPTGKPLVQFDAFLTFRSVTASQTTAPSYDLRWDPARPWGMFDGRSSTHGEATWIPSPQTVWAGDTVTVTATAGYFVRGISEHYSVDANINVRKADAPPSALPVPFSVSADGSALTLTIPDAVHATPLNEIVPRIDVSLTDGLETYETILIYLPLVFRPSEDTVPPTVIAQNPVPSARAVARTAAITATFGEPVTGVTLATFTLRSASGAVPARVDYAVASNLARLRPLAPLGPDRRYTARLSGIRDLAGNLLAPQSWTFTTGPAPTITAVFPPAGSTNVPRGRSLVAVVSEPVLGVSPGTVKLLVVATGARVAAAISYDPQSRTITIDPAAPLAVNTRYRATITGGVRAVRDLAGNPLATRSLNFSTSAAP